MGGNGNSSFTATILVTSLLSLVNVAQKEEKENNKQRGISRDKEEKIVVGGL
jgi:hypothetical protein